MAVLNTTNLTLSPCRPDDRPNFIDLELDPDVMHFLNGGTVDHKTADPEKVTFFMPSGTEPYVWTARRTVNDASVGWFCLFPENEALAEIGYRLRRIAWGQGLASKGASAVVDWGFRNSGYEKIVACIMAVNHGSHRVMEKIGISYARKDFPEFLAPSQAPAKVRSGTS